MARVAIAPGPGMPRLRKPKIMPFFHPVKVIVGLALSALIMAAAGVMPLVNALVMSVFAALLYGYSAFASRPLLHNSLWVLLLVVGIFVASFRPSHFHYPLIASEPFLHPDGQPFRLYLNLSKALAGWMLVVFFWKCLNEKPLVRAGGGAVLVVLSCVLVVLAAAVGVLNLEWALKLPGASVYFIPVNILVTCVAEEAFFRLLLQKHLMKGFVNAYVRVVVPAAITGVIFALAHHADISSALFVVYWLAGIGYALVYALTGRFVLAVTAHAGVNIGHFLLLPYPLSA